MTIEILCAIFLPFAGTVFGSAWVFLLKGKMNGNLQCITSGLAAGVMVAASIWSLIIPSIEQSSQMGSFAFFPAVVGVWGGFLFLFGMDDLIPYLHRRHYCLHEHKATLGKYAMLILAVALHNLPEGMAVGVAVVGWLSEKKGISASMIAALSLGIALQNIPEGAIVSMPLRSNGMNRNKSFLYGVLSGVIEPIGAIVTILLSEYVVMILPYLMSFSAGAMLYVVVEELFGNISAAEGAKKGTFFFVVGFTLMMALDVALG